MTTTSPSLPSAVADAVTLLRAYARVFGVLARREPAQADVAADALEAAWAPYEQDARDAADADEAMKEPGGVTLNELRAAPAVGPTRERVMAERQPHLRFCAVQEPETPDHYCSCGAYDWNAALANVLALYRSEDATPEGERR